MSMSGCGQQDLCERRDWKSGEDFERLFSVLKRTTLLLALGSAHMLSPKSGRHVRFLFPPWLASSHCLGVGLNVCSAEDVIQNRIHLPLSPETLSVFSTPFSMFIMIDCLFLYR